jgi:hypothetical protein
MVEWLDPNGNTSSAYDRRKEHEKSNLSGIGGIRSTFTVRGDERVRPVQFWLSRRYSCDQ